MLYAIKCWLLNHSKILNKIYFALHEEEDYRIITWEDEEAYEIYKD